ncbi:MAG: TRL-like family protein [bacterium]|nr:TRL-like family protein [bacterium]
MKTALFALVVAGSLLLGGCAFYQAPVMPPPGFIVSSIQAPIDTDADQTPVSTRQGEASSMSILGLVAVGDASIKTAAEEGGLKKIDHVDYRYLNVLFIFQKFTTIVYGE